MCQLQNGVSYLAAFIVRLIVLVLARVLSFSGNNVAYITDPIRLKSLEHVPAAVKALVHLPM
jgi:hypothetical protein